MVIVTTPFGSETTLSNNMPCCQPRVRPHQPHSYAPDKKYQESVNVKADGIHDGARGEGYKISKLSVLDQVTTPYMIIKLPFVYRKHLEKEYLLASLKNTLDKIPLIAGRVIKDKDGDFSVMFNGKICD